jgi:hypothetical protein
MERKRNVFLLFLFLLVSCNKIGVKDSPIPVEQIFGTYDLWNGKRIITLNPDYTYVYMDIMKSDTGIWNYYYFTGSKTNQIETFDMRAISENGEKKYYSRYMTHRFYVCKHWGRIIITNGYEGDPDGAPALKWYKKIE